MELKGDYVSKIGLGSVQFGMPYGISNTNGQTSPQEVTSILHLAKKSGIDLIDTAFSYGNSQDVLGKNDLTSFDIVSKFKGDSPSKQLEKSLESLNVKSVYGFMAHWPKDLMDYPHCWGDLQKAKALGLVSKIGFSLNEPEEFHLLSRKGIIPDIVQAPYNILDRRFENILIELKESGCEIHSRSTFLQGLLFLTADLLHPFFDEVRPFIAELQKNTKDIAGLLLKFVLSQPFIDKVIIGVNDSKQLKSNLEWDLTSVTFPKTVYKVSDDILMPWKWPKK